MPLALALALEEERRMLSLVILTVALIAVTRWLYHMPERQDPKNPWNATRKEPKP